MRRSKATLFLFELVIIILIFAICCAICLSLFTASRRISIEAQDLSYASVQAQSVAESLKSCRGNLGALPSLVEGIQGDAAVLVYYDTDWQVTQNSNEAVYTIEVSTALQTNMLRGKVIVYKQGENIYELPITQYLG